MHSQTAFSLFSSFVAPSAFPPPACQLFAHAYCSSLCGVCLLTLFPSPFPPSPSVSPFPFTKARIHPERVGAPRLTPGVFKNPAVPPRRGLSCIAKTKNEKEQGRALGRAGLRAGPGFGQGLEPGLGPGLGQGRAGLRAGLGAGLGLGQGKNPANAGFGPCLGPFRSRSPPPFTLSSSAHALHFVRCT